MKYLQASQKNHSAWTRVDLIPSPAPPKYQLLAVLCPQPFVLLVGRNGFLGEGVVLPPGHQCSGHGQRSRHQLVEGLALDGQRALAEGTQHLVQQSQQQTGRACEGTGGNVEVHSLIPFRVHVRVFRCRSFCGSAPECPSG